MTVTRSRLTSKAATVEKALRMSVQGLRKSKYHRPWPPHSPDELRWWYKHHSPSEIAETYQVAGVTLRWYWRSHGLPTPRKNWRENFFARILKTKGCWIWTGGKDEDGYGCAVANGIATRAHRISWEIHNKTKIPTGLIVLHSCDNPSCVNPKHLSVGTYKDNSQDAARKGRLPPHHGEHNGRAKMDSETVLLARVMCQSGLPLAHVSARLGVKYAALWSAVNGRTWTWL